MEEKVYEIDPLKVIVKPGRQRELFEKGAMVKLIWSIKRFGQIQPGVCTKDEGGEISLVVGERRLKACAELGIPYKYILREEIEDELRLKEIELEENIQREDLTWQEDVLAKLDLHETKQKIYGKPTVGAKGGHTMQDTADQLHISKGLVSQDVELAMWLREIPEIGKAKNKSEAKKMIQRMKEATARKKALKASLTTVETKGDDPKKKEIDEKELQRRRLLEYDRRSLIGKFEEKISNIEGTFDLILFDPPWGVEYDAVGLIGAEKKKYRDSLIEVMKKLPEWLEVLYGKMSNHAHLYIFFGIVNHEWIYNSLERVGFETNRMPLVWWKKGAHSIRHPKTWPGRSYEPIAYARKGSKDLLLQGKEDVICTPPPTPSMKKDHPNAKHPQVYIDLLLRSGYPGDRVLDPMSGSGMVGVACEHLKATKNFDWYMIEKDPTFRNLGIFNLMRGFRLITTVDKKKKEKEGKANPSKKYDEWGTDLKKKKAEQLEGKKFADLKPGTPEWKEYWKAHPEEQDAMLAFAKEKKGAKI